MRPLPEGAEDSEKYRQEQAHYFEEYGSYRGPHHPVVEAFVLPKIELIQRHVDFSRVGSLLDVGCGNGVFTAHWGKRCPCVGLDLSLAMLSRAQGFPVVQGDALALPFRPRCFDVAFAANLLHHLPHPLEALREMARVSRSWVISVEPNAGNPPMWLFGLLCKPERRLLRFSRGYLRRLFGSAGLPIAYLGSTGMVTQNRTPQWMIPLLRPWDRESLLGAYTIVIARSRTHEDRNT